MERKGDPAQLKDHVVICNANAKVRGIVEQLRASTQTEPPEVVLLDPEPDLWARQPQWRPEIPEEAWAAFHHVIGRPADVADLRRAGIRRAKVAIILAEPRLGQLADARSTLLALAIERENPKVHTIMELIASVNRVHLRATEINEVVCRGEVAERLIAQSCITPGVKNIFAELLAASSGTNHLRVVPLDRDGSTYRDLVVRSMNDPRPRIVCGFVRVDRDDEGRPRRRFVINPPEGKTLGKDTPLRARQDELIVISREG